MMTPVRCGCLISCFSVICISVSCKCNIILILYVLQHKQSVNVSNILKMHRILQNRTWNILTLPLKKDGGLNKNKVYAGTKCVSICCIIFTSGCIMYCVGLNQSFYFAEAFIAYS